MYVPWYFTMVKYHGKNTTLNNVKWSSKLFIAQICNGMSKLPFNTNFDYLPETDRISAWVIGNDHKHCSQSFWHNGPHPLESMSMVDHVGIYHLATSVNMDNLDAQRQTSSVRRSRNIWDHCVSWRPVDERTWLTPMNTPIHHTVYHDEIRRYWTNRTAYIWRPTATKLCHLISLSRSLSNDLPSCTYDFTKENGRYLAVEEVNYVNNIITFNQVHVVNSPEAMTTWNISGCWMCIV